MLWKNIWKTYPKIWYNYIVGQGCEDGAKCHNFGQKNK